ncbi:MAG: bacterial type and secretion system family protein, partial [Alphaproteobacteria bacterium]|nr:bacterial type and secretion system family protein [Alphaproteobacteria bacterium]
MFRYRPAYAALLLTTMLVVGCTSKDVEDARKRAEQYQIQDRELGYTRDDFRKAMAPRPVAAGTDKTTDIPDLAPVIADDKKNILPQPLVSITVNQDVPIRDIFYELAKQAEVDLELDPIITGSIIFTAYNRPFDQVVDRICEMSGLRYTFKNNVLRIERDTPYMKTYNVGYLSVQRDYTSTISSNTSAASSGGGGGSNGSSSTITSKSGSDFWAELQTNINQIIVNTNSQVALTDQSSPITTPQAIPAVSTAQLTSMGTDPNAAPGTAAPAAAAAPAPSITINTGTPPVAGLANPTATQNAAGGGTAAGAAPAAAAGGGAGGSISPYFSVNRQAGLINVFATEKQQR